MSDWSRDGTTLVFSSRGETNWDIWAMRVAGDRKPFALRQTRFAEFNGALSPDGRFLAYQSNESRRPPAGDVTVPAVVVLNWTAALESTSR